MFLIPLTNSELSVEVSEEDHLTLILLGPWYLNSSDYALTTTKPNECLHRIVANRMNLPRDKEVDHKDRNKFNAKRNNLVSATRSEQMINRGLFNNNTSGHKNISYDHRRKQSYVVQVRRDSKLIYVGGFVTLEEAIQARDAYFKRHNITFIE